MSSVDNRLVKMTFDNADFEKRASGTLGTLDKLKQSLDFSGALKGMDNIQAGANSVTFEKILDGIEALQSRFSVLGEFVNNTFIRIVDSAINTGKQLVSALTIEPLKDGFAEYETQMNSVQTILANVRDEGKKLSDVTAALDELNTYADKTIYNFTEMTRNIGTFTAAGVDLNTSVTAIQGIANLAAVSGASSNDASRAMYQLSQALAAGVVHLQDWNSVQTANIGGETFQRAIEETAVLRGALTQEQIDAAGSFRALLNAKDYGDWFSADILLESLEKFTAGSEGITKEQLKQMQELYRARGYTEDQIKSLTEAQHVLTEAEIQDARQKWKDRGYNDEQIDGIMELGRTATDAATKVKTFHQLIDTVKETLGSGWTKSFEYIVGDFEKAKELWTEINDILSIYINASADARNATLKEWNEGGGREAVIDGLRNAFQGLLGTILPVKEAFDKVFPAKTGKDLIEYSKRFKAFTEGLKVTDEEANKIRATAERFFTILRTGFESVGNIASSVWDILKAVFDGIVEALSLNKLLTALSMIVNRFETFTESIKPSAQNLENIRKIVNGIVSVLQALAIVAVNAGSAFFDAFGRIFTDLSPTGQNFMDLLGQIGEWLTNFSSKFENAFNYATFAGGFNSMADAVGYFLNQIGKFTHLDDVITKMKEFFTIGEDGTKSFSFLTTIADFFSNILEKIGNFISQIDLSKIDLFNLLGSIFSVGTAKKVYNIISAIYDKLKNEDNEGFLDKIKKNIVDFTESLTESLETIRDALTDTLSSIQTSVNTNAILKIAIAIGILVLALGKLASMDPAALTGAMIALSALMGEITFMTSTLGNMELSNIGGLSSLATNLIKIAASIFVLAKSVKVLAELDADGLSRGLLAISMLLGELLTVAKVFTDMNGSIDDSIGSLIKFAAALWILAKVVKSLAKVDPDRLVPSMIALTTLLGELVGAAIALSNTKLMENPEQLSTIAFGLVIFSAAVRVLVMSVKALGNLKPDNLIAGMIAVTALIVELGAVAVALSNTKLMENPEQLSTIAFGLVIFSAAVRVLVMSVKALGELKPENLIAGVLAVTALLVELAAVAKVLGDSDIIKRPDQIGAIGFGLGAFVASIKALADIVKDLASLSEDPGKMIAGILAMTGLMVALAGVAYVFSDKNLDPVRIAAVSGALVVFSVAMGLMTLSLMGMASLGLPGIIIGFIGLAGALGLFAGAAMLLTPVIPSMLALSGAMVTFGLGLALVGVGIGVAAAGLAMLVGAIAAAGITVAELVPAIIEVFRQLGIALAEMWILWITTIAEHGPELVMAISTIIQSILLALQENVPLLIETLLSILTQILESLAEYVPRMAEAGLQIIGGFLQAVAENLPLILDSAITIALEFINGITARLPDIIDAAFKMIIGFIDGLATAIDNNHQALFDAVGHLIESIVNALVDGVTSIVGAVGDWITGPNGILKALEGFVSDLFNAGAELVQGFIDGLLSMPKKLWDSACSLAQDAWNAITHTLDEHSPSRLTYGGGANFVLGFINGIDALREKAAATAGAMAYEAMKAFDENVDTDSIYSPTITPVIDAGELQNGISTITGLFDEIPATYDVTANITANNAAKKQIFDVMSQPTDYSSIISRMDSLEESFGSILDKLGNLSVIMDSGALVGAISSPMDSALGMRQTMVGRGVL